MHYNTRAINYYSVMTISCCKQDFNALEASIINEFNWFASH